MFHQGNVDYNNTIRLYSHSTTNLTSTPLKVAIVGAGASGMSTALHLAPLVKKGLIAKPIHVYEKTGPSPQIKHPHELHLKEGYDEQFHPGSGHIGREVGIGIWSTALEPFLSNNDNSDDTHLNLIRTLEDKGQYVGKVGYRTPSGKWLTKDQLNTHGLFSTSRQKDKQGSQSDPALLFIREKDFLSSLRKACETEEEIHGTIQMHNNVDVDDIQLSNTTDESYSGYLQFSTKGDEKTLSEEPFHLIIAAEGMQSKLRRKFAGYAQKCQQKTGVTAKLSEEWEKQVIGEINTIEDRKYTVFRGNAPLSDSNVHMDGASFQTWGEGNHMRFAAVSMSYLNENGIESKRDEEKVWFATICDSATTGIKDAEERKELLVKSFEKWHDPVGQLIKATPAKNIFVERGVAHKHSVYPVFNLSEIFEKHHQSSQSIRPGPILIFSGDAAITVDPVLAQGFTIAMESAADLAQTLEISLSEAPADMRQYRRTIEDYLTERNQRRYERMLCLIRATELVQAISQPSDSLTGFLSTKIIRPAMMLIPSVFKEAAFSYMIKYSLGLYGSTSFYNTKNCEMTKAAKIDTRR